MALTLYSYCPGQEAVVTESVPSNNHPEPVEMTAAAVPSIPQPETVPAASEANQEIDATEDSKQTTASDDVVSN